MPFYSTLINFNSFLVDSVGFFKYVIISKNIF